MILHPDTPGEEPGDTPEAEAPAEVAGVPVTETKRGLVIPKAADFEEAYGPLGRPFSRHSPFYVGFWGFLGVALAYVVYRAVADISGVLLVIGVALFLAVGLEPAVDWLVRRGLGRGLAVVLIIIAFLAIIGGFVASAVPPIAHEVSALTARLPRYRHEVATGQGWLGHLVRRLHLASYIEGKNASKVKSSLEGGALGAGRALASATTAIISGIVLTIYFLVALPRVKRMALNLVPASRRERAAALTEETFSRVGGFVLGNVLTSIVSGIGTYIWLAAFGVPYPFLLALFVALLDLIPVIGSTVAGVVVSLVALNAQTMAVRPALERRWSDAVSGFDARHERGVLGVDTRADTVEELSGLLQDGGVEPEAWYGVWLFSDLAELAGTPLSAGDLEGVAAVELLAASRDPYRQLSRLFHLLGRRR